METSQNNITVGQKLAYLIDQGKLAAGDIGVLYGEVEPRLKDHFVKIGGWYRSNGHWVVTVYTAQGKDLTNSPGAKFARYTDQDDAKKAFDKLEEEYRHAVDAGDYAAGRDLLHR